MKDTHHRNEVIRRAVAAGKFPQRRVEHYRERWNRDPEGTEALIASLTPVDPNLLHEAGDDTVTDEEMQRLFGQRGVRSEA